jgi:uncharacterized protein YkwD
LLFFTALAALGASACAGDTIDGGVPSVANPLDAEENGVIGALNEHRAAMGLAQVTVCKSLNVSASKHSDDMRDNGYLGETGSDGSTVRTRTCAAGYTAACGTSIPMAELVASGNATGKETLEQWVADATSNAILFNASLVVAGVGSSQGADGTEWTLDLGGSADPSCN